MSGELKEFTFVVDLDNATQVAVAQVCTDIAAMLVEKNRKYGDSALSPLRIFSKADRCEQLRVRIDDKLSRISNARNDEDEDVILDLIGYLVLYRIALGEK